MADEYQALFATERDWIVLYPYPEAPPGWMPEYWHGRWFDRTTMPVSLSCPDDCDAHAVAVPTGRFEFRDQDGACAEIWEVRPA